MTQLAEPSDLVSGSSGEPAGEQWVEVVVARQPVADATGVVVGYELVHRPGGTGAGPDSGAEVAGSAISIAALLGSLGFGVDELVGPLTVFCRVPREVLSGEVPISLPSERTVLDVPAELLLDPVVRDGCRQLAEQGHDIAVSGLRALAGVPGTEVLLSLADLVRIDLASCSPEDVALEVERHRRADRAVWVDGCDTPQQVAWALEQGVDLVQGRAVHRPTVVTGKTVAPSARAQLQLSTTLLGGEVSVERLETILRGEPALVVQLLSLASQGAAGGLRRTVRSLREALVLLGTDRLRQWAGVMLLHRHSDQPSDALATGLARARMCELLAPRHGIDPEFAFTAGLLSAVDRVLGVPSAEVRRQLELDPELAAAAFDRTTPLGVLVGHVADYRDAVEVGVRPGPELGDVDLLAAMAFCWAMSYVNAVHQAARA
ncbi:EAL and HDOD domain-containing protein [Nocardioides flavescens]|uniref:HDOD domain-containing protein n=1 Tax=Nocardioides flavescens TaxID=2691959 RepID=A0A6L7EXY8_9ACTN|nr:HDOD domain-containing protein [Nocardioides flavescens]MXG90756.1 HDOD domain-containing protein [Nocardioides flavescens]